MGPSQLLMWFPKWETYVRPISVPALSSMWELHGGAEIWITRGIHHRFDVDPIPVVHVGTHPQVTRYKE